MATQEETTLVLVSATNNNNKFYRVTLDGDGISVTKTWGRVGTSGTSSTERTGRSGYDRVIREKTRKGYKETETVSNEGTTSKSAQKSLQNENLKEIATKTLLADATNGVLIRLIETLVARNNHDILEASGGQMKINADGLITTPLGLVSKANIEKARNILMRLPLPNPNNESERIVLLNDYLTLVPQKVGSRGWHNRFITNNEEMTKQVEFLKQLEESLSLHADRRKAALAAAESDGNATEELANKYADLFKFKISLLEDKDEFKRIDRLFESGKSRAHSSYRLKLKRVYVIEDEAGKKRFEKKAKEIGNVRELWHGTRVWNVLSILRRGLMIAAENLGTVQINGKMFGAGAYFANSKTYDAKAKIANGVGGRVRNNYGSTKSLNYSEGYWDGRGRDSNCFMFLADVAMGNAHVAQYGTSYSGNHIQRGGKHDSLYAKGGLSGVQNDEIIVWDADQINLKYLCEFDA